tara:strand:+ start:1561 stop:2364 length:804 start_codon:yes stop_codon:yes gene_type:complete
MDLKQGLLCGLTGKLADFEGKCPSFDMVEDLVEEQFVINDSIRPNKKRADLAQKIIWLVLILEIVSIVSSVMQYNLLLAIEEGMFVTDEAINSNDIREQIISLVYSAVYIISSITFIMWFRRAYFNLALRSHTTLSEGWAAGAWFVPIISWFRPYQIMKEIWTKSSELIQRIEPAYKDNRNITILNIWWTLWIIVSVLGQYVFRTSWKGETILDYKNSTIADIVSSTIGIPLAITAIMIIGTYSVKEEKLLELEKQVLDSKTDGITD